MKSTLRSLLLLAATSLSFAAAQAQVVTYNFTGTRNDGSPETYFGDTVTGTITVNLSAPPSTPDSGRSEWRNVPGIKITAKATNFNGGTGSTSLVDDTVWQQQDVLAGMPFPYPLFVSINWLGFNQIDGSDVQQITANFSGPINLQWDINKLVNPGSYITDIGLSDASHGAGFTITSITLGASNLFIGSTDTGIKDFTYQGQQVSALLAGYAASAKNHGDYVESVEKLAEKLLKAKLLTKAQAETLKQAAAKSSIGQKPKKDDKDNKGKSDKDKDDDKDD